MLNKDNDSNISVIVPIYRIPENMLRVCIESLLNQTLEKIEIILVDDGNDDLCRNICDEYAKLDLRVSVIHQHNQGVSVARNNGLVSASSRYVAFVDADDWVDNTMLEKVYKVAVKHDTDLVMWEYSIEKENAGPAEIKAVDYSGNLLTIFSTPHDIINIQRSMIGGNLDSKKGMHGGPVCKLYKRNIISENNIIFNKKLKRSQDNEFNFIYTQFITKAVYIQAEMYHYRQYSNSATHKYQPASKQIQEEYLYQIWQCILKYKNNSIFLDDYYFIVMCKYSDICITDYAHPDNPWSLKQKVIAISEMTNSEPYSTAIRKFSGREFKKVLRIIILLAKHNYSYAIYIVYIIRYYLKRIII